MIWPREQQLHTIPPVTRKRGDVTRIWAPGFLGTVVGKRLPPLACELRSQRLFFLPWQVKGGYYYVRVFLGGENRIPDGMDNVNSSCLIYAF